MDYPEEQHSNLLIFYWVRMHKEEDDGAQKLRHPLFIISIYSTSWIPEISLSMISE